MVMNNKLSVKVVLTSRLDVPIETLRLIFQSLNLYPLLERCDEHPPS